MRCTVVFSLAPVNFPVVRHWTQNFYGRYTQWAPAQVPGTRVSIASQGLGKYALGSLLRRRGHHMWKRDEAPKPTVSQPPAPAPALTSQPVSAASQPEFRQMGRDMVNIGKS